jgi:D-3-phosphoglycerate dehydrogenase / 2-oxoglutarate reductase
MINKVLIIDEVHELLINGLVARGVKVNYQPKANRNDLLHLIADFEGLIVRTKTIIDKEVFNKATKLCFIGRAGAGLDNIDTTVAKEQGVAVFNAGEANADAVGEHTLAMMLNLFAKINKADSEVRKGIWDRKGNTGVELRGKIIGVVGFGNTGNAVARKLRGFGVNTLVFDKYLSSYSTAYALEASLEQIFNQADVLTLHVPLTSETNHLVNGNFISKFKKSFWLFNLSRGKVVNTNDLINAIEEGKILGAGLDVLENEQLQTLNKEEQIEFNYLINSDKVLLSPHVGGWTNESYYKISEVLLKKIDELILNQSVS